MEYPVPYEVFAAWDRSAPPGNRHHCYRIRCCTARDPHLDALYIELAAGPRTCVILFARHSHLCAEIRTDHPAMNTNN